MLLTLSALCKKIADDILKHVSYFPQKIDFDISCNLSPGDNLHEISKPVY